MNTANKLQNDLTKLEARKESLTAELAANEQRCNQLRTSLADAILSDQDTSKPETDLFRLESKERIFKIAIDRAGEEIARLGPQLDQARLDQAIERYMALNKKGMGMFPKLVEAAKVLAAVQEEMSGIAVEMSQTAQPFKNFNFQAEAPTKTARFSRIGDCGREEIYNLLTELKLTLPELLPDWETRKYKGPVWPITKPAPDPDMSWLGHKVDQIGG